MTRIELEDHATKGRFVIYEDDKPAGEMTFSRAGDKLIIIDHTGVNEAFGGKGYGKLLVGEAVEYAREKNIKILPLCPFAKRVFDKEEAFQDVRHS